MELGNGFGGMEGLRKVVVGPGREPEGQNPGTYRGSLSLSDPERRFKVANPVYHGLEKVGKKVKTSGFPFAMLSA